MASREHLIGRPLVPFFDADDNVNEALRVDHSTRATEQLDVDARVWDRELGYFVYPTAQHQQHQHSQPIDIKRSTQPSTEQGSGAHSLGKMLLTPDMLFSRSAPTTSASGMHMTQQSSHMNNTVAAPLASESQTAAPRSASAKRASRQKTRSGTPTRSRNKQRGSPSQTTGTDGGSSGGEGRSGSDSNDKNKKNGAKTAGESTTGSTKKNKNKKQDQSKASEDLSANGKWAWSAFQSSPDPKSLPLPPFVVAGTSSPGLGALPPPKDPPKIEERLDPPLPPSLPPDVPAGPPPATIEHSMTQDLRRMLNIGS